MSNTIFQRLMLAGVLFAVANEAPALAFSGTFSSDDQYQFLSFKADGTSQITLETTGYAAGGFDPYLTLFASSGLVLKENDDGATNAPDSYIKGVLAAGTYWLAVTEAINQSNGLYFANGFAFTRTGNFTGPDYGCSNGKFCDYLGQNRTGFWALDVTGVVSAQLESSFPAPPAPPIPTVPEPATIALMGLGLAGMFRTRRHSV
ncbi:MAG: DVUA0089 family protein [Methylococcaceae bacterium]|nr:DVUA0089 family protein [Methylococcaceae bacterium]